MAPPPLTRILVVDDEPDIRNLAKTVLEKIGNFTVQISDSGSHTLQVAPQFRPDLILLDVMMPGMDGPATLKALRALPQTAAIPVIFLTGKVQIHEVQHYKKLGALDVIPKPFDPMTLCSSVIGIWGLHDRLANPVADMQEQLKILRKAYATQVPGKIEHLKEKWRLLFDDVAGKEVLMDLHLLTHSLAGSCETFGFGSIRKSAHQLELLFADLVKNNKFPPDIMRAQISGLLDELAQAGSEPPQIEVGHYMPGYQPTASLSVQEERKVVFLAGSDAGLTDELTLQLGYFGYTVQNFKHLVQLEEAVHTTAPAAIIMDTKFVEGQFNGAGTIAKIQRDCSALLPIVFISNQTDVDTRLRAVHAGGHAYFTMPVDIGKLVAKLDSLIADQTHTPYRVLIVEDEPNLAKHYALTLEQAGMQTRIAEWVTELMQGLVEFSPDLVLMDLYLPGYNGIDLAGMIRQQEAYVGMPIVFLSSEADLNKQMEAMNIGADDFLTKPIDSRHLVSLVQARVHRARTMRCFMVNDSLTGLLNHAAIKEQLDIEVARVKRNKTPVSVALVDIDNFKTVNDSYG
ncbi:MAG: response regulator, partial [Gammaproteobacteria bacterium]